MTLVSSRPSSRITGPKLEQKVLLTALRVYVTPTLVIVLEEITEMSVRLTWAV
jgi:hypothetical protein